MLQDDSTQPFREKVASLSNRKIRTKKESFRVNMPIKKNLFPWNISLSTEQTSGTRYFTAGLSKANEKIEKFIIVTIVERKNHQGSVNGAKNTAKMV